MKTYSIIYFYEEIFILLKGKETNYFSITSIKYSLKKTAINITACQNL